MSSKAKAKQTVQKTVAPKPRQKKTKSGKKKQGQKNKVKHVIAEKNGSVITATNDQLRQLSKFQGGSLPEGYVLQSQPSSINMNNVVLNGGSDVAWEAVAESIISSALAKAEGLLPPVGPAVLKGYLFWCWMNRMRLPNVSALKSVTSTLINIDTWPLFDEQEYKVPVLWAKFIEYLMPYTHPTGAKFKYTLDWDALTQAGQPALANPSIQAAFGSAGGYFNRSVLGFNMLTGVSDANVGTGAPLERLYGENPASLSVSNTTIFTNATAISNWFDNALTTTVMSKVPIKAPDGSMYSYILSAQSGYPTIYSNATYVDAEVPFIFHKVAGVSGNTSYQDVFDATFEVSPIFIDDYPTTSVNTNEATTYQALMQANAAYICSMARYVPGGMKTLFGTLKNRFPGLNSFRPIYWTVDLDMYHNLCARFVETTVNLIGAQTNFPLQSSNLVYATHVVLDSALWAHNVAHSFPSIMFYTKSDMSACTAISAEFKSIKLPPTIAEFVSNLAPVVNKGCLYVPLFDLRDTGVAGSSFQALNSSVNDPVTGRWLNISDAPASIPPGQSYPSMFCPSTALATVVPVAQPTAADTAQLFAFPMGQNITTNFSVEGDLVTRASVLGAGVISNTIPNTASRYVPFIPFGFAKKFVDSYVRFFSSVSQNFVTVDSPLLGSILTLITTTGFNANATNLVIMSGASWTYFFDYRATGAGCTFPFDKDLLGRTIAFCYRRASTIEHTLFQVLIPACCNSTAIAGQQLSIAGANTAWMARYQAQKTRGANDIAAVRSANETIYQTSTGLPNGQAKAAIDAMLLVLRATQRIHTAGSRGNEFALSLFNNNSPSLLQNTLMTAQNFNPKRVPLLSPIFELGTDILSIFFP